MKKTNFLKRLSFFLCLALIAAVVLMASGCNGKTTETSTSEVSETTLVGEGQTQFTFTVVDQDGNTTIFTVSTDEETVGAALLKVGLIAGEDSAYGLYVKTVNGITADYDTDGTYWAFYINGEYAMTGVDSTAVEAGANYSFKVEKG